MARSVYSLDACRCIIYESSAHRIHAAVIFERFSWARLMKFAFSLTRNVAKWISNRIGVDSKRETTLANNVALELTGNVLSRVVPRAAEIAIEFCPAYATLPSAFHRSDTCPGCCSNEQKKLPVMRSIGSPPIDRRLLFLVRLSQESWQMKVLHIVSHINRNNVGHFSFYSNVSWIRRAPFVCCNDRARCSVLQGSKNEKPGASSVTREFFA